MTLHSSLSDYAKASALGIRPIGVCQIATVGEIPLRDTSMVSVIDEHVLAVGDRILVKNQSLMADNGIYIYREPIDGRPNLLKQYVEASISDPACVCIESGGHNAGTAWVMSGRDGTEVTSLEEYMSTTRSVIPRITPQYLLQEGPGSRPMAVFPGNVTAAGDMNVSGMTQMDSLTIRKSLIFGAEDDTYAEDRPTFTLKNGTINNSHVGGLMLKVFDGNDISRCRNVLTTVSKSIAYGHASWTVDGVTYVGPKVSAIFTGYIKPRYAENALLYLTSRGSVKLWIDGQSLFDVTSEQEGSHTSQFDFRSTTFVPFVLQYQGPGTDDGNTLLLEWSFFSAPVRQIVPSSCFAFSGHESGPSLLGPFQAHGDAVFHGQARFEGNMVTTGDVSVSGKLLCSHIGSRDDSDLGLELVCVNNTAHMRCTGGGFQLRGTTTEPDPIFRLSTVDGTEGILGTLYASDSGEKHVTLATANREGMPSSPLSLVVGGTTVATARDSALSVYKPLIVKDGLLIEGGRDLTVTGDIHLGGQIYQNGKLTIGAKADAASHLERFTIVGDNASAITGPHLATYTTVDQRPLFQLASWSHDDISLNFDASFDGSHLLPTSRFGAQIHKGMDTFAISHFGSANNWKPAWTLDLKNGASLFSGSGSVFSHADVSGEESIRMSPQGLGKSASIGFYRTENMRTALKDDWFRLGYINDQFKIQAGHDTDLLAIDSTGDVTVSGAIHVHGQGVFDMGLSVEGQGLNVKGVATANRLVVAVDNDSLVALDVNGKSTFRGAMNVDGRLLTGRATISGSKPRLQFHAPDTDSGVKALGFPRLGESSNGARIILSRSPKPTQTDIAIGIGRDQSLWSSVSDVTASHQWYAGERLIMSLTGSGSLHLKSDGGKVSLQAVSSLDIGGFQGVSNVSIGTWAFQTTEDSFVLNEIGGGIDTRSPILLFQRDPVSGSITASLPVVEKLALDHGSVIAKEATLLTTLTVGHSIAVTGRDTSLTLSESFAITTDRDKTGIVSKKPLFLNCEDRGGRTVIHRGNTDPIDLYNGEERVLRVSPGGVNITGQTIINKGGLTLNHGTISAHDPGESTFAGSLSIGGDVEILGNNGILFGDNNKEARIAYDESFGVMRIHSAAELVLRAKTGIQVDPGKGDLRIMGTLRVKGTALTANGLLLTSGTFYSQETLLKPDAWYYIAKLNTTPRAQGNDEQGSIQMRIANLTQTMFLSASLKSGKLHVDQHVIETHAHARQERASVIVLQDNQGSFHVFLHVPTHSFSTLLTIVSSCLPQSPSFSYEGSGAAPNGSVSQFLPSWTLQWSSGSPSTATSYNTSFATLTCEEKLISKGSLSVDQGATIRGNLYANRILSKDDEPLRIGKSHSGAPHMLVTKEALVVATNLRAESGLRIDLGPFNDGSFEGVLTAQSVETDNATVRASLKVTDIVATGTISSEAALFESIVAKDSLEVRSLSSLNHTTQSATCADLNVLHAARFSGPITFFDTVRLGAESRSLQIGASDICLHDDGGTLRLAADGNIRSKVDICLVPAAGRGVVIGDASTSTIGMICGTTCIDSQLEVTQAAVFKGGLTINAGSRFNDGIIITQKDGHCATFGSTGEGDGMLSVSEGNDTSPLLSWSLRKTVNLFVPFSDDTAPSLTISRDGDVSIKGNLRCSPAATGHFGHIRTGSLTVTDNARFNGGISLGIDTESSKPHLRLSADGALHVTAMGWKAAVFAYNAEKAVSELSLSGDLIVKSAIKGNGLQVGQVGIANDAVNWTNDTQNAATIQLLSKRKSGTLVINNSGGDIRFQAAKGRGFSVAAISGNAVFQGQLNIDSALDVSTSLTSDVPVAALNVAGGIVVKRSILVEGAVQFGNNDGARVAISAFNGSGEGYNLRLPRALPNGPGHCLVTNGKGQLSWKPLPNIGTEAHREGTDSDKITTTSSFSASHDIQDDVIEPFAAATGRSFSVPNFVVIVKRYQTTDKVAVYEIRGVRVGDKWVGEIKKCMGDELPFTFRLLPDGRLSYSCGFIEAWKETLFTWTSRRRESQSIPGRQIFGTDHVIDKMDEAVGSFLAVKTSTCTRTAEALKASAWAGTHFSSPHLIDEGSAESTHVATVSIENAPRWAGEGKRFALYVQGGDSKFDGPVTLSRDVQIESNLNVAQDMLVTGALRLGGGSGIKTLRKGVVHVGSSGNKTVTVSLSFDEPMADIAYTMIGSAVSADPDSPDVFTWTFKGLTRMGCKVLLCNVTGESWTDVTVRFHWMAIL